MSCYIRKNRDDKIRKWMDSIKVPHFQGPGFVHAGSLTWLTKTLEYKGVIVNGISNFYIFSQVSVALP